MSKNSQITVLEMDNVRGYEKITIANRGTQLIHTDATTL